jgi:hypothetical protein
VLPPPVSFALEPNARPAVYPHLETTTQRPDWLAGFTGFELPLPETLGVSLIKARECYISSASDRRVVWAALGRLPLNFFTRPSVSGVRKREWGIPAQAGGAT